MSVQDFNWMDLLTVSRGDQTIEQLILTKYGSYENAINAALKPHHVTVQQLGGGVAGGAVTGMVGTVLALRAVGVQNPYVLSLLTSAAGLAGAYTGLRLTLPEDLRPPVVPWK